MTEKRANEILRTKYPEASIIKGQNFGGSCSGRMVVVFQPNGKAYQYRGCNTYQSILERLGFNILYKHNVEAYNRQIKQLEDEIAVGGFEDIFGFSGGGFIPWSEQQLYEKRSTLARLKDELANAIID